MGDVMSPPRGVEGKCTERSSCAAGVRESILCAQSLAARSRGAQRFLILVSAQACSLISSSSCGAGPACLDDDARSARAACANVDDDGDASARRSVASRLSSACVRSASALARRSCGWRGSGMKSEEKGATTAEERRGRVSKSALQLYRIRFPQLYRIPLPPPFCIV